MLGKEARDLSGLGSHREGRVNTRPTDPSSLAVPGTGVTPESLDRLELVQLVHDKYTRTDVLLYFLTNGSVFRIKENGILLKCWEELEHVLYMFKIRNGNTWRAAEVIKGRINKFKALQGVKSDAPYVPKYRDNAGKIIEMKKNSARLRTDLGTTVLEFNVESDKAHYIKLGNEMKKNKINHLRAAIYQINGADPELKKIKESMERELEEAEKRLLVDYLRTSYGIQAFN